MIQVLIFLFLSFTSVLSYPSSINKDSDRFELPNEFWSKHFGLDFKDAIHYNLQQSDIINIDNGNILQKHFPEDKDNANYKRSTYVLHTPKLAKQQNRTFDNFMKVQLLSPGEVEALEKGMKDKEMYRSPLVVTLPSIIPNYAAALPQPLIPNTNPAAVYPSNHQNSVFPQFFQNNYGIWPQSQHYIYDPKTVYQQFGSPSALEKKVQSSYENNMNMNTPSYEQISQPSQEKKTETLVQPSSFEKPPVESSPEQHLKNKTNDPSYDKAVQPSIDNMTSSTDKMQPSTDNIQPSTDQKHQPSTDQMHQPSTDQKHQPSTNEMIKPSYETIQPSFKKVHATFEKIPSSSYPQMRHPNNRYEEISSSELNKQNPYEEIRHPSFYNNNKMMSYDKTTSTMSSSDLDLQSLSMENLKRTFEQGL